MSQKRGSSIINAPIKGLDEEKYQGQWLVIDGNNGKILLTGNSLDDVEGLVKAQAIERPVYYKVPTTEVHHVVVK